MGRTLLLLFGRLCVCVVSVCVCVCVFVGCVLSVKSTEGISEIWFREPFPRRGLLRFRVRVRFTYGQEFTRSESETSLWSYSGFDGPAILFESAGRAALSSKVSSGVDTALCGRVLCVYVSVCCVSLCVCVCVCVCVLEVCFDL